MTYISSLHNIHKPGLFGNFENKNEKELIKIKEIKNLSLYQIVKYKKSNLKISDIKFDNLEFPNNLKVSFNDQTRILWMGPDNWLITSDQKNIKNLFKNFNEKDFAITDLSHSRSIIELEGNLITDVIKKGCPLNLNEIKINDCSNSIYNGINLTLDFLSNEPKRIRVFTLRSFGASLYHSITDASLEFGYKSI